MGRLGPVLAPVEREREWTERGGSVVLAHLTLLVSGVGPCCYMMPAEILPALITFLFREFLETHADLLAINSHFGMFWKG